MSGSKMTNSVRWRNFRNKIDNGKISQKSINQNLLEYIGLLSMQIEGLQGIVNDQSYVITKLNESGANLTEATNRGFSEISTFINTQLIPEFNAIASKVEGKTVTKKDLQAHIGNEEKEQD